MKYLLLVSCLALSLNSIAAKNQIEVPAEDAGQGRAYENLKTHEEKGISKRDIKKSKSGKGKQKTAKTKVTQ